MPRAFHSTPFVFLVGKTLERIDHATRHSEQIEFTCTDGTAFHMYHEQDCCERVSVEDITGDIADLIGTPIVQADERSSREELDPDDERYGYGDSSHTWTFYRLRTARGDVTIRWHGASNGYYSERVTFVSVGADIPVIEPEDL